MQDEAKEFSQLRSHTAQKFFAKKFLKLKDTFSLQ